ncbi:hypothetical protein [Pedobacter agri]|uniref:hypothetical protein n=1 Tax=Pedobacter agri TaxID=454586 RepID=UPI00292D672C|nr:hypothetical protein [Pedobacter agri]
MILIDKSDATQKIVFSSNSHNDAGSFLLIITSDSGRNTIQIPLNNNISNDVERCFIYDVDSVSFNGLESGFYTYQVMLGAEITTSGKLLIKQVKEDSVIVLPESTEEREFIIYNGE